MLGSLAQPSVYDGHERALQTEPRFTVLARDPSAPHMVRQWAYEREREIARGDRPERDRAMVAEARRIADAMEKWRAETDPRAWRSVPPDQGEIVLQPILVAP